MSVVLTALWNGSSRWKPCLSSSFRVSNNGSVGAPDRLIGPIAFDVRQYRQTKLEHVPDECLPGLNLPRGLVILPCSELASNLLLVDPSQNIVPSREQWKNYRRPLALMKFELKNVTANLIRRVCGLSTSKSSPLIPMNVHVLDVFSPRYVWHWTVSRASENHSAKISRQEGPIAIFPGGVVSPAPEKQKHSRNTSIRGTASFYISFPRTLKAFRECYRVETRSFSERSSCQTILKRCF